MHLGDLRFGGVLAIFGCLRRPVLAKTPDFLQMIITNSNASHCHVNTKVQSTDLVQMKNMNFRVCVGTFIIRTPGC